MLELKNIRKKYKERVILDDINLKLPNSGMVFLLGDSGVGKTSLLNIIGMLDTDFSGQVLILGESLTPKKKQKVEDYHKEVLGFIFQDYNLLDYLTVKENITLSVNLGGKKFDESRYEKIIEKLNLTHLQNNLADQLSGGEKQRVAIARALLRENSIILADEPTGNLDKDNSKMIFDTLKDLSKDRLVIIVTHNEAVAFDYGDSIIRISDGVVVEQKEQGYTTNDKLNYIKEDKTIKTSYIKIINSLNQKYTLKNLKKVIPALIMMTFCLITIGLFLSIYDSINNITDVVNQSILENDKITIADWTPERGYKQISEEFYNTLIEDENINYDILYYNQFIMLSNNKNREEVYTNYSAVDYNEKFDKRYEDLDGAMPKSKYEVVISQELAEKIFDSEDFIGEVLEINAGSDRNYQCKIVGCKANDEMNVDLYITKEFSDEMSSEMISMKHQVVSCSDISVCMSSFGVEVYKQSNMSEHEILYGRDIENQDEILLDVASINYYLGYMGEEREYELEELISGEIDEEDLKIIFDNKINFEGNGGTILVEDVEVVGIVNRHIENDSFDIQIVVSDKLIEDYSHPIYNTLDIYVDSLKKSEMESIYNLIERYEYEYSTASGELGAVIRTKLTMLLLLISVIMLCMISITVVMIHYATKVILNDRVYEVGVLKSLGASNGFILRLFLVQNGVIGLMSGSFAAIIIMFITRFKFIKYEGISLLRFSIWPCTIAIAVGITISVLSGLYEMLKITNKSVVDCLRDK